MEDLLASAGLRLRDLSAVAVGLGPGSYTGLRAGLSYVKGLALAPGVAYRAEKTNDWQISASEQDGVFGWLEPGKRIQTPNSFDWVQLIVFDGGAENHGGAYEVMVEP